MPSDNPYAPPVAPVNDPRLEVPDDILKRIKQGWVAALICAGVTLVVTLFAMFGTVILDFSADELFDVALICGLAYGIYRKSRVCAVLMLIYFIASKIYIMVATGKPSGSVMGVVFAYYFWQAVTGTFAYHKLVRQTTVAPSRG